MGERALGWGFRLLGIGLMIGPILAALAVYGASLDLIMPEPNPLDALSALGGGANNQGMMNVNENDITLISLVPPVIRIPVELTLPIGDVTLEVNKLSASIKCANDNENLGSVELETPVNISSTTQILNLRADLTQAIAHYINTAYHPTFPDQVTISLEGLDITIYELTLSMPGSVGSMTFDIKSLLGL